MLFTKAGSSLAVRAITGLALRQILARFQKTLNQIIAPQGVAGSLAAAGVVRLRGSLLRSSRRYVGHPQACFLMPEIRQYWAFLTTYKSRPYTIEKPAGVSYCVMIN